MHTTKDTAIRVGLAHVTGDDEELSEDHDDEGAGGLHCEERPLGNGIKGYPLVIKHGNGKSPMNGGLNKENHV